jgi:hypothetical protein
MERSTMERELLHEVFESHDTAGEWRVEAIAHHSEGECFVVIFSGPFAEERARDYCEWINGK